MLMNIIAWGPQPGSHNHMCLRVLRDAKVERALVRASPQVSRRMHDKNKLARFLNISAPLFSIKCEPFRNTKFVITFFEMISEFHLGAIFIILIGLQPTKTRAELDSSRTQRS